MSSQNNPWLRQSEQLLQALQSGQKSLQQNWAHLLGEMGDGWAAAERRLQDESPSAQRYSPETRPPLGHIARQIAGSLQTAEALAQFAQQFLSMQAGQSKKRLTSDPVALWQQVSKSFLKPPPTLDTSDTGDDTASAAFLPQLLTQWAPMTRLGQGAIESALRTASGVQKSVAEASASILSMDAWDQLTPLVGDLAKQPFLGPIDPELMQRSLECSDAHLACLKAGERFESRRLSAWSEVGERFAEALAEAGEREEPITSLRMLLELWVVTGDQVLTEMHRSESYLQVQRDLLESLMHYRITLQSTREVVCKANGLPTRAELDDAYRAIHELRREVRALTRAQRESGAKKTASSGTAAGASRKAGSKKKASAGKKARSKKKASVGKKTGASRSTG